MIKNTITRLHSVQQIAENYSITNSHASTSMSKLMWKSKLYTEIAQRFDSSSRTQQHHNIIIK